MIRLARPGRGAHALLHRGIDDLRHGRNLDTYVTFAVGIAVTALGIFDVVHIRFVLGAMLAALAFLVLHAQPIPPAPGLDDVLCDRSSFEPFPALLGKARDVRVYGPTAVHVIIHAAEHRRLLLDRGGRLRIVIQGNDPAQLAWTGEQLDKSLDFGHSHAMSLGELRRLAGVPGFEYRLLGGNPGFSMVVVDADAPHGYLVVEFHGFADVSINDRMHVRIGKTASPHWFAYWLGRFEAIWNAAAADTPPLTVVPAPAQGVSAHPVHSAPPLGPADAPEQPEAPRTAAGGDR